MIHPTALVDPAARIGADVAIGAYSVIGADVEIGDGTAIGPHVRHRRPDAHRPRQPHLPVRLDRRRPAGQEVRAASAPSW